MTVADSRSAAAETRHGWALVGAQELRDLWIAGRGLSITLAYSVLLSAVGYLAASNQALNFLEQREAVGLLVQASITVGALLVLLASADAVSGERERGTLETLLLTPVSRLGLTTGKLLAALSLWIAAFVIALPYVWLLARRTGLVGDALAAGLLVGTLLALFVGSLGLCISVVSSSNRVSLSLSLVALIALFAPTQLPSSAQRGWAGELLLHLNPFTAAFRFVDRVIVNGRSWSQEATWLAAPLVGAVLFTGLALFLGARRLRLRSGGAG